MIYFGKNPKAKSRTAPQLAATAIKQLQGALNTARRAYAKKVSQGIDVAPVVKHVTIAIEVLREFAYCERMRANGEKPDLAQYRNKFARRKDGKRNR